jgi:pimeloyl-ACP methyl ester carboxylesterase
LGQDAEFTAAVTEPALSGHVDTKRVYLSLPGCGSAPLPEVSSDAILDVLVDWVRSELGAQSFALVGYSYGGYLAAGLARRLGAQIDRLLLVCSGVKIIPGERDLSGVLPAQQESGWLDECPVELHEHLTEAVGRQHREVGARLAAAFGRTAEADENFIAQLRGRYRLSDELDLMPLEQPATFIAGRRDRIAGFRDQFAAAERCSRANYLLFAEAGHYLPAETPQEFAAAVRHWLT